ncbi:MAG: substrate-binding domain-containing protein [Spirochaetaceae bacterium]
MYRNMKKKKPDFYGDVFFKVESDSSRRSMYELFSLLYFIDVLGSIRRSAEALGFSYRHSWNLIQDGTTWFGEPLLETSVGGKTGGGALLTGTGRKQLSAFIQLSETVKSILRKGPLGNGRSDYKDIVQWTSSLEAEDYTETHVSDHISGGEYVVLATTMEPVETGLLEVLEEQFFLDTGIKLRHVAAGSGQALTFAREGRVDITLTHAPEEEETFLQQGWGTEALTIMSDPFVIVGPRDDPGGIEHSMGTGEGAEIAAQLFSRIAETGAPFLSRGDGSGTHIREQKIWERAGIMYPEGRRNRSREPNTQNRYRFHSGQGGNISLLRGASEMGAYSLVDRAAFILYSHTENKGLLKNFTARNRDPLLENFFRLILVNPERFSYVRYRQAVRFREWVCRRGGDLIEKHGTDTYGTHLFRPVIDSSSR